jgi:hypothetical protein
MFETMLRSGVPPHMGQSPVPGSEAEAVNTKGSMQKAQNRKQNMNCLTVRGAFVFQAWFNEGCGPHAANLSPFLFMV